MGAGVLETLGCADALAGRTHQVQGASIGRLASLFPGQEDRSSWGAEVLAAAGRRPAAGGSL